MKFGYARVSTADQVLDRQTDQLEKQNCDEILSEKISGKKKDRPEFNRLMDKLRPGDSVVIVSLDRLGRNLKHLIELSSKFEDMGVELISLKENIDTSTAMGKFFFQITGAFAEFEANLLSERTKEGLDAARSRGRVGGRKRVMTAPKIKAAKAMLRDPNMSITEVARHFNVSRATIHRRVGIVKPDRKLYTKTEQEFKEAA